MADKKRKRKSDSEIYRGGLQQAQSFLNKISGASVSTIEREKMADSFSQQRKTYPPRAKGSERSFAFESTDPSGRKTIRYSDKPEKKKGERLLR